MVVALAGEMDGEGEELIEETTREFVDFYLVAVKCDEDVGMMY